MTTGYSVSNNSVTAYGGETVTPSDSNELPIYSRWVYVGGTGDVKATLTDGSAVVFKAVPVGTTLPISCKLIWSTGTSATLMVALY